MDIYNRYLCYARRSQVLLSRFNELYGFCDDRELVGRLHTCTQNITLTFIRNITEIGLQQAVVSFFGEITGGNNLSIVIELYETCGHLISGRYDAHPRKSIFAADFAVLSLELIRLKLLLAEMEDELISEVKIVM